ncbi:hypothetical protein PG994_007103 [Apiospora phragmitis]|uniref:Uncharacterized protein n=1 Tax=Apiospora phragmitis TaxID=2905665 RepID=A0ABR1UZW2_9PEZI
MDQGETCETGLQEYDSKELEDMKPYHYKRIQGGKKRIRLIKLKTGHTDNREIVCEFYEAEYDTLFHIPKKISHDREAREPPKNTEDEDAQTAPLPEDHQDDAGVDGVGVGEKEAARKRRSCCSS